MLENRNEMKQVIREKKKHTTDTCRIERIEAVGK